MPTWSVVGAVNFWGMAVPAEVIMQDSTTPPTPAEKAAALDRQNRQTAKNWARLDGWPVWCLRCDVRWTFCDAQEVCFICGKIDEMWSPRLIEQKQKP